MTNIVEAMVVTIYYVDKFLTQQYQKNKNIILNVPFPKRLWNCQREPNCLTNAYFEQT